MVAPDKARLASGKRMTATVTAMATATSILAIAVTRLASGKRVTATVKATATSILAITVTGPG